MEKGTVRIGSIVIDCDDFDRMMTFWEEALHYGPAYPPERGVRRDGTPRGWVILKDPTGRGPNVSLNQTNEGHPEEYRLHLDLYADDQEGEVRRLIGLGASLHRPAQPGEDFVVLADLDRNLFCVVDTKGREWLADGNGDIAGAPLREGGPESFQDRGDDLRSLGHPAVLEIAQTGGLRAERLGHLEGHPLLFGRIRQQEHETSRPGRSLHVLPPVGRHVGNRRAIEIEDASTHRLIVRGTDSPSQIRRHAGPREPRRGTLRILRAGFTSRLQQSLAKAWSLELESALVPHEFRVKDGRHVDDEAAQRGIEGGRHAQDEERSHVMPHQIDRFANSA
jgi:glyoxalase superfamily protein